jgi:pimeloyl-ACP methyl ester carboxylesterase
MLRSSRRLSSLALLLCLLTGLVSLGSARPARADEEEETPISLNKPATATNWPGCDGDPFCGDPQDANDGDVSSTLWIAQIGSLPQSWTVDLQSVMSLSRFVGHWYDGEPGFQYRYRVEVSNDNQTFATVIDRSTNQMIGRAEDAFPAGTRGRYVRVVVTGAEVAGDGQEVAPEDYVYAYEFSVYGTEAKTPLIFVPGIGGTRLLINNVEAWPRMQEMWDSDDDAFLLDLQLAANGSAPLDPAKTATVGDIIRMDHVVANNLPDQDQDTYASTITQLEQGGYVENESLFVFPYDWRKDNREAAALLLAKINQVLATTGASKVDILAHSMGGLVTRAALANPASVGKIRKVMTLGTPVLGATKALGLIEYQGPCFVYVFPWCVTNPANLQTALRNAPGAYQLLPSRAFDQAEGAPLYIDRDTDGDGQDEGLQPYDGWSAIVAQHRNGALVQSADTFHQTYDDLTLADPEVEYVRVIGDKKWTMDRIREYEDCNVLRTKCEVAYDVVDAKGSAGGDGTVPLHSADLHNAATGFDWRDDIENRYAHDVEHGELATDPDVLQDAKAFFAAQPAPQGQSFQGRSSAQSLTTSALSNTPAPFGGIEVATLGPVKGYIFDASGRKLGFDPALGNAFFNSLPGGDYNAISRSQSFFLNQAGAFNSTFKVTAADGARIRVRTYANNTRNGQAVFSVNAPVGATLHVPVATGQALSSVRVGVDRESDGVIDSQIAPETVVTGAAATDVTPPTTRWSVSSTRLRVVLTASDTESGVATTYYSVNSWSGPFSVYTGPIPVTTTTKTIHFYAVDQAGNVEAVRVANLSSGSGPQ